MIWQPPRPPLLPFTPQCGAPEAGAALRVTAVPCAKLALHVAPQLIPAGVLVTVPVPAPARVTVSGCWWGGGADRNVAVRAGAVATVKVKLGDGQEHAPPQPVNAGQF